MKEPIDDGGKLNKAQKGVSEFVVTGANAALGFDPTKEVFNPMPSSVVTAMEPTRMAPAAFGRDAATGVLLVQPEPKDVRVEAFVGHDPTVAHPGEQGQDRMLVMLLARGQTDPDRSASGIHDRRQFGVQSTFGPAHRLGRLSSRRIGPVLMQLDVRAVQVTQFTLRVDREQCEHLGKQPGVAPSSITSVNRTPRAKAGRQIPPRHAGSQHIKDGAEHKAVILGRPTPGSHCANLPNPTFSRPIKSIFLAAPIAARVTTADLCNSCATSDSHHFAMFHHFENTP